MADKGLNLDQQGRNGTVTQRLLSQALLDLINGKADQSTVTTLQGALTQLQSDLASEASRATGVESGLNGRLSTVETTLANISAGANPDSRPSVWAAYDTLAAYTANQGTLAGKRVLVLESAHVGIYVDGTKVESVDAGAQVPVEAHGAAGSNTAYEDKISYLLTNGNWQTVGDTISASHGLVRVGNDIQAKLDSGSQIEATGAGLRLKDALPGQV